MEQEQNIIFEKYANQLAVEIARDEGEEVGKLDGEKSKEGNDNQSSKSTKHHKFTLGRLLSLMGGSDNSPYVSAIERLNALLGQIGKRGLDEVGKTSIENCIKDINKFSPEIAEVLKEALENYGYDLDVEIPHEGALLGFYAFAAYKISNVRKIEINRMGVGKEAETKEPHQ